jgi:hypothetical protein
MVVANYGDNTLSVWQGVGNGEFTNGQVYVVGHGPKALGTSDFNQDYRPDVVVGHAGDGRVLLLTNVQGRLALAEQYWVGGSVAALAVAEVNGDGRPDVVVADWPSLSLQVLLGQVGGGLRHYYHDPGVWVALAAQPAGLAVGQLDRDGYADVVVAQWDADEVAVVLNNRTPRVGDLKLTGLEDRPVAVTLKGSAGPLRFTVTRPPTNGTLSGVAPALEYRSFTNQNGKDYFEYVGDDGVQTSAVGKVHLTILAVNDAPELELATNLVVVAEDRGLVLVPGFVRRASPGPWDERRQVLRYNLNVQVDRPGLFVRTPGLTAGGVLLFMAARNGFGEAQVEVQAADNGGTAYGGQDHSTAQWFVLRVENVNDAPTLSVLGGKVIAEDQEARWDIRLGDAETPVDALAVTFGSTNAALLPVGALRLEGSGTNRTVVARPLPDQFGKTLVTVTVSDGTNSASRSALLMVSAVNDAPTVALVRDSLLAPAGANSTNLVVNLAASSVGPANESAQKLRFTVSNPQPELFVTPPVINTQGYLILKPRGFAGKVTLEVRARDYGGTIFGGVDISAPQSISIELR